MRPVLSGEAFSYSLDPLQCPAKEIGIECPFVRFVNDNDIVSQKEVQVFIASLDQRSLRVGLSRLVIPICIG